MQPDGNLLSEKHLFYVTYHIICFQYIILLDWHLESSWKLCLKRKLA